eukprot:TRINITY_DN10538_c0_g1_i2.p1 TRINITY_DN10538_c0_g1~~TRINITY_DN10538_c0_g1_i2.p1  ORF type:complete len:455 (-),score=83.98 TRINITY_DN10538_c0_g1_i2:47-1411(-)
MTSTTNADETTNFRSRSDADSKDIESGAGATIKRWIVGSQFKEGIKKLRGVFMLYFLFTVLFWGTQDFLLSFLATRNASLESGDTLAFLSVGNLFGMLISKLFLWQWKKFSWGKFVGTDGTSEVTEMKDLDAGKSPASEEPRPTDLVTGDHDSQNQKRERLDEMGKEEAMYLPNAISGLEDLECYDLSDPTLRQRRAPDPEPAFSEKPAAATSRFDKIRKLLKKPVFLEDSFKLSFISGVIGSVAPLGYYELSARGGEASTVAPLISLYVIVPAVLGLVFLKERKSVIKFLGIGCAIAAVVLFALGGGANWSLATFPNLMFFFLGFFGWGIAYFVRSLAAAKGVDFSHMILMATAGLMFGNYLLVTFWFGVGSFKMDLGHGLTMVAGCCGVMGDTFFFLLSKEGKEASKVVPLTGCYILLPAILGFAFLRDTVTVMKMIAIVLSLLALVLLGAS